MFKDDVRNELFNVGTGIETSLNQLKDILFEKMGRTVPVEYLPYDEHLVKRRQCSTEKTTKHLGFTPQITLDEGIDRYLAALRGKATHHAV
jgi:UDP-glucose 4-epimerase